MLYHRERYQVLNTIKLSGNNAIASIQTYKGDPMGGPSVLDLNVQVNFVQANYSNTDIADPSISSGLMKILVPSIDGDGKEINLESLVMDKSAKVVFSTGKVLGIKSPKLTMPDGVTPIVARLFLGG